jgi:hypothetical protein
LVAIDPAGLGGLLTALMIWHQTTMETFGYAERLRNEAETRVNRAEQAEKALSEFIRWCDRRTARKRKRKSS